VALKYSGKASNITCAFTIYDRLGQRVVSFNSANSSPKDIINSTRENLFICDIVKLTISPGNYSINVALFNQEILQDHILKALEFKVEEGQIDGRQFRIGEFSNSIMNHTWKTPGF
jgi:hypothetical protein